MASSGTIPITLTTTAAHPYSVSAYNPSPWERPNSNQQPVDYYHYNQWDPTYQPRLDVYPFPAVLNFMGSPAPEAEPTTTQTTPSGTKYPNDPYTETREDGRIEMSKDEIDAINRKKRKVTQRKACYACHCRKIKCNRELPCDSCVKRHHPELCSYEWPDERRRISLTNQVLRNDEEIKSPTAQSGPNITVPKEHWERINAEPNLLQATLGQDLAWRDLVQDHLGNPWEG